MKRQLRREGLWLLPGCIYGWLVASGMSGWQYQKDLGLRRIIEVLLFGMVIGSLIYGLLWIPRGITTAIKEWRGGSNVEP